MLMDRTKQCRRYKWLFAIIHIVLLFGPLAFFVPYAFTQGAQVGQQTGLSLSLTVSLILLIFSFMSDIKHRAGLHKAIFWLLVGGVILCLESIDIRVMTWVMVVTCLVDELVILPARNHYALALVTNIEIDKREQ